MADFKQGNESTDDAPRSGPKVNLGYKTFFMLNSAEHEIFSANMKMSIIVGIFIFISRDIFMLSQVSQEKNCNC